jgi:hypothetical protein
MKDLSEFDGYTIEELKLLSKQHQLLANHHQSVAATMRRAAKKRAKDECYKLFDLDNLYGESRSI